MSKSDIDELLWDSLYRDWDNEEEAAKERIAQINALYIAKFEACLPEKHVCDKSCGKGQSKLWAEMHRQSVNSANEAIDQTRDNWYKGGEGTYTMSARRGDILTVCLIDSGKDFGKS